MTKETRKDIEKDLKSFPDLDLNAATEATQGLGQWMAEGKKTFERLRDASTTEGERISFDLRICLLDGWLEWLRRNQKAEGEDLLSGLGMGLTAMICEALMNSVKPEGWVRVGTGFCDTLKAVVLGSLEDPEAIKCSDPVRLRSDA